MQVSSEPSIHSPSFIQETWSFCYLLSLRGWFDAESRVIRSQSCVQVSRSVPFVPPGVPSCLQDTTDGKGSLYSNRDAKFTLVPEAEVTGAQVCKSSERNKGYCSHKISLAHFSA